METNERKGYTVYGVNPNYEEIDGEKIFASYRTYQNRSMRSISSSDRHMCRRYLKRPEKRDPESLFPAGHYDREIRDGGRNGFNYIEGDCVYALIKERLSNL